MKTLNYKSQFLKKDPQDFIDESEYLDEGYFAFDDE